MWKNYLIVALRNLKRQKAYGLITVLGLALGLAGTMIILLYVRAELGHDAALPAAERTYRVTTTVTSADQTTTYATTVPALASALDRVLPEVEHATRFMIEATESNEALFAAGDRRFYEARFAWADSAFFEVFALPFIEGDARTALARPFTVVLTESAARRYFGDEAAVGQTLRWNDQLDLEVTGVMADPPDKMHFRFDVLASLNTFKGLGADGMIDNWGYRGFYTYAALTPGADAAAVEAKLATLAEAPRDEAGNPQFGLQPVTDIHLHSGLEEEIGPNGSVLLVYLLVALAVVLLFVAGVNFVNLTTARSARRAREIGVRKAIGAERGQLVRQFLAEAVLMAGAAYGLALGLTTVVLPLLREAAGAPALAADVWFYAGIGGVALVVGVLAGIYPAVYLSSFRPTEALVGAVRSGRGPGRLRAGLVVAQFALSIVLIAGTALIYQQLRYVQDADLGFDRERVVALPLHAVFGQPQQDVTHLKQELERLADVHVVSATSQLPSRVFVNNWAARAQGAGPEAAVEATAFAVTPDFLRTLGISLAAGRTFSATRASDAAALIVNEAAARRFGWDEPIGKDLYPPEGGEAVGTVIGVVEDFHFQSMRHQVGPVVFRLGAPQAYQYVVLRLAGGDVASTMAAVEEVWAAGSPEWPFSYVFLDDAFDAMYRTVEHTAWIVGLFALLALIIACLGLVGSTAYAVEQRTKEFGIRKVLGASVSDIVVAVQREHVRLVLAACVAALPLAFLAGRWWLQDFAYHVEVSWSLVVLASLATLAVALLTVSYQAVRAAQADPVDSLRYE